jgi:transposase
MTTDEQVRRLMSLIKKGLPLSTAAAKAGMSEPTARKYRRAGQLPGELKAAHTWRTRPDPFEAVWPEVEALLEQDAGLQAKTVFEELKRRHPESFQEGQLRTLQRRFREWRALHGDDQEVFFAQRHHPGEQAQSDFTRMGKLGVTISGARFPHMLYHFVLTYSNWESVSLCFGETFEALSAGLQGALWRLGGVPQEHRTDNLSAATHELKKSRGRGFTERYRELLEHYGLRASKNTPGRAHENGDVESSHRGLKNAVDQRLRLRGSRDFTSVDAYLSFVEALIDERNAGREARLAEERAVLGVLPVRALPTYREEELTVKRFGLIRVAGKPYSLPSRLIGHSVKVRLFANHLEVTYRDQVVARPERVLGDGLDGIDYRHLVHSLVRKPGAFRRYVYREALFPTLTFRRAYDALAERSEKWADLEYVRILHLAATTMECEVEAALAALLEAGQVPEYDIVKARVKPAAPLPAPEVHIRPPDLGAYDALLGQAGASR